MPPVGVKRPARKKAATVARQSVGSGDCRSVSGNERFVLTAPNGGTQTVQPRLYFPQYRVHAIVTELNLFHRINQRDPGRVRYIEALLSLCDLMNRWGHPCIFLHAGELRMLGVTKRSDQERALGDLRRKLREVSPVAETIGKRHRPSAKERRQQRAQRNRSERAVVKAVLRDAVRYAAMQRVARREDAELLDVADAA